MKTYKTQGTCSRAIEFETAGGVLTACRFIVGVLPLVFSSGAGCESRQTIGLVTFCGLLVATVIGISFPPVYFAMFSRLRGRSARHG